MDVYRYEGSTDDPFPPAGDGWALARGDDSIATKHASGLIGSLPVWSYGDELVEGQLYRFFAYREPVMGREHVGALRFVGTAGQLGMVGADDGLVFPPPPNLPPPPEPGPIPPLDVPPLLPGGGGGGGGGSRRGDSECSSYVADASDPQAVGIANGILFHGDPVPYTEGGGYYTTIGDTRWLFTMQTDGAGLRTVWAWRCIPRPGHEPGSGDGKPPAGLIKGIGTLVIAGLVAVGGIVGIGAAVKAARH